MAKIKKKAASYNEIKLLPQYLPYFMNLTTAATAE
jgi:hypothetical protein